MSKKLLLLAVLVALLGCAFVLPVFADEQDSRNDDGGGGLTYPTGYRPSPIDLSDLSKNPPKLKTDDRKTGTGELPETYDLRDENRLSAVRDQNPFGTCWTFAAMGALESNWLTQKLGDALDLSELHMAWFVYKDPAEGRSFYIKTNSSYGSGVLGQGGNAQMSTAFLSRMAGPVDETKMPYTTAGSDKDNGNSLVETFVGSNGPEAYHPVMLRLKDTYSLGNVDASNRNDMKPIIKQMVRDYGGVQISYYAGSGATSGTEGTTAYFDNTQGTTTTHAVVIVGWNDNFDAAQFNTDASKRPSTNGAWLVRNSWGDKWPTQYNGDGYFWMSYEQYIGEVTVYIADKSDDTLKHYGYDMLGQLGSTMGARPAVGSGGTQNFSWGANIFKAESDNEAISHVGFYTRAHESTCDVYIYDLGTTAPTSPVPSEGTPLFQVKDQSIAYAGYHTLALDSPKAIAKDHYFSVVMRFEVPKDDSGEPVTDTLAVSMTSENYAYPAAIQAGQSFCSGGMMANNKEISNTNNQWRDTKDNNYAVCIKAFTIIKDDTKVADINETNFPDEAFRNYVSTNCDLDKNNELSVYERKHAASLNIKEKGIANLKGIELFTNLESLDISGNKLLSVDLSSKNANITNLRCCGQAAAILKFTKDQDGKYCADLSNYLSDFSNKLKAGGDFGTSGSYQGNTLPETLSYEYDTGIAIDNTEQYLAVTLSHAQKLQSSKPPHGYPLL